MPLNLFPYCVMSKDHSGWHFKYRLFRRIKARLNSHFEGILRDFLGATDLDDDWLNKQFRKYMRYMKLTEVCKEFSFMCLLFYNRSPSYKVIYLPSHLILSSQSIT
jgi:hypothetical protein